MSKTIEKKSYHHGNLHDTLMEEGISIIYEEGFGQFSLRKLAKRVGVSATAIYNHYEGIDDLLRGMQDYVSDRFAQSLQEGIDFINIDPRKNMMLEAGKKYVQFFSEHPHYFSFVFENMDAMIDIKENDISSNYVPFNMFKEASVNFFKLVGIPENDYRDNLLVMWACVHGLAAMANMKPVTYEGDWGELTEQILKNKLNIM